MNIPVFDAHADTPTALWPSGGQLNGHKGHISLASARKLSGYVQFFAFCMPFRNQADGEEESRFRLAKRYFFNQLLQNQIPVCKTSADVRRCMEEKTFGAMLSVEGAEAIGCDASKLISLYDEGFRMLAPVWNHENALSGSCVTGGGLTQQGREFCKKAQSVGILLDVSHLSDAGFFDLCDIAERPIAASHSNSRAVTAHPRNLTDTQFSLIRQLGGCVGINLYSPFLSADGNAALDDVYRHIDHFMEQDGDGCLCLGGDLDGCDSLPEGFTDVSCYVNLYSYLQSRGYSEQTLKALFCDTLISVLSKARKA